MYYMDINAAKKNVLDLVLMGYSVEENQRRLIDGNGMRVLQLTQRDDAMSHLFIQKPRIKDCEDSKNS